LSWIYDRSEVKNKAIHNLMQLIGIAERRSDLAGDFLLF
jgi:hypothetical protein